MPVFSAASFQPYPGLLLLGTFVPLWWWAHFATPSTECSWMISVSMADQNKWKNSAKNFITLSMKIEAQLCMMAIDHYHQQKFTLNHQGLNHGAKIALDLVGWSIEHFPNHIQYFHHNLFYIPQLRHLLSHEPRYSNADLITNKCTKDQLHLNVQQKAWSLWLCFYKPHISHF